MNLSRFEAPLDVPTSKRSTYLKNLRLITKNTGRLLLFAGDQRVEHLNDDFFKAGVSGDDASPEHLFRIASASRIGVFATQLGLAARYGTAYPRIPYLIKLNAKTNLVETADQDPYSGAWYDVRQVAEFANSSKLTIPAIGYTVYVGSKFESAMLREAAQAVWQAHQLGLVAVLWMYPRGAAIEDKLDAHLIAGAINVGTSLGADFVKVNRPNPSSDGMREIILAAAGTRLLFAGGGELPADTLIDSIHTHIKQGAAGAALGRNLHQRPLAEAIAVANAAASVIYDGQSPQAAARHLR